MSRNGQLFMISSILVLAAASAAAQQESSVWDKKNEIAGLVERDFASGHAITSPSIPPPFSKRCAMFTTRNHSWTNCRARNRHVKDALLKITGRDVALRRLDSAARCPYRNYGNCFSSVFQRSQAASRAFLSPSRTFGLFGSPERMKP